MLAKAAPTITEAVLVSLLTHQELGAEAKKLKISKQYDKLSKHSETFKREDLSKQVHPRLLRETVGKLVGAQL